MSGPLPAEVLVINLSAQGFWLLLHDEMLPVRFTHFPCFRTATIEQLVLVEHPTDQRLHWPRLDVDLSIESLRDPEAFPLVPLKDVGRQHAVSATRQRPEFVDWSTCEDVDYHPERHGGAWVFRRTRVPIAALFENLASGVSIEQFVEWFPGVSLAQSRAVLEHVARGNSEDEPHDID